MVLELLCSRLKVIFLGILGIVRRGLCCFSRRRKVSLSESDTLESVNVVADYSSFSNKSDREKDWNSWDDSPRTVEEHIEQYRQKLARPPTPKSPEPEPDFFEDMTPKIKPPQQVIIKNHATEQKTDFSRLEAKSDISMGVVADLHDWVEEDAGGWEELDNESTKQMIREKRKEMRVQRQIKQKDAHKIHQTNFAERITPR